MKKIEELLLQAKGKEKIIIDKSFKKHLKERIFSRVQMVDMEKQPLYIWKRMSIILLPVLASLILFFSFYPGEKVFSPSVWQESQEPLAEKKQEAMLFSNRSADVPESILQAPAPAAMKEDSLGGGQEQNIVASLDNSMTNITTFPHTLFIQGGFVLVAILLIIGAIWYVRRKKK